MKYNSFLSQRYINTLYSFTEPEYARVTLNTNHSFHGRKYEHAMKHGTTNGLFLVTIGWFVDSVKRNGSCSISLFLDT